MSDDPKPRKKRDSAPTTIVDGLDILDPKDPTQRTPVNAVIYGAPGSGKTYLASTANSPLIVDLEDGAMASVAAAGNPDARVVNCRTMADVRAVYAYLRKGKHPHKAVVLDPFGELQRMIMNDVIASNPSVRRQYGDQPTMADWGKSLKDTIALITAFRALPINVVVLAHAEIPQHEEDMVQPLVSGKSIKPFIMGAMDLLAYLHIDMDGDEPVRKLLTQSTATVTAKNRGGRLDAVISDPNLAEIFRIMEE